MKRTKKGLLFVLGGGGYVGLEYLWRGRSHPTMFVLGGLCFFLMGRFARIRPVLRPVAGAAVCTGGELIFGLVFNRDHKIWDYRAMPCNLWGQICLPYSLLWAVLAVPAMGLYRYLEQDICGI